jgi:hypothetical protein
MMEMMNDAERNRCMVGFQYSQAKNACAQPLVSLLSFLMERMLTQISGRMRVEDDSRIRK